jgi:hypothetical protein
MDANRLARLQDDLTAFLGEMTAQMGRADRRAVSRLSIHRAPDGPSRSAL